MIERLVLTMVLSAVGFLAYRGFSRYHVMRAAVGATTDPILSDLKPGIPAIVYFTTPMCVPCRTQQQPALMRLQTELGDNIQIVRIDATQDSAAADRWGVFSAPTTFVLDGSKHVRQVNHGVADTPKLRRQIDAIGMAS
ncbi:MAG: thioredoxin family protein [Chloroflexota bacterium]